MMTLEGFIAVLSLAVGCFSLGYAIGRKDIHKTQKQPPVFLINLGGYFCSQTNYSGLTVYW